MKTNASIFSKIQHSYAEIIDEKNRTIARLEERLASVQPADTVAAGDILREMAHVADHVGRVSMSKHIFTTYRVSRPTPPRGDRPAGTASQGAVEYDRIEGWLRTRLKTDNVIVYIEEAGRNDITAGASRTQKGRLLRLVLPAEGRGTVAGMVSLLSAGRGVLPALVLSFSGTDCR